MKNTDWFYKIVFTCAIVIYFITAYNSNGYYHYDEHYQIIEFAQLKLGESGSNDLAWEYKAEIRPTTQPTLCFGIIYSLKKMGMNNPYHLAFILRLITAIFTLLTINYFIKQTEHLLENINTKRLYYILSYFLWFCPFISVRFSSETWSGVLFLLTLSIFLDKNNIRYKYFFVGCIAGFSFLFRFQAALLIFGFGLWLIFINREKFINIMKIAIAFIAVVLIGFIIDSWFYNDFVFTPWVYFDVNINQGIASYFGKSPWYYYLTIIYNTPSIYIGIPILAGIIILTKNKPKTLFIWCILPFLIIHSIIPHKETRFLFPIIYLFPIVLIMAYKKHIDYFMTNIKNEKVITIIAILFLTMNFVGVYAMGTKSAGIGRMEITKYIYDHYKEEKVNLMYFGGSDIYDPVYNTNASFYKDKNVDKNMITDEVADLNSLHEPNKVNLILLHYRDIANFSNRKFIGDSKLTFKKQSTPQWNSFLSQLIFFQKFNNIYYLYEVEK